MATATITFDLNDMDDTNLHERMMRATDMCMAIHDFLERARHTYKHLTPIQTDSASAAEYWRDILLECLDERGVDMDKIFS